MPDTHTPARSSPARKPTPKPTEPKPKPTEKPRPVHPGINTSQPARPPKPCRPLRPPSPRQNRDRRQELEPRQGTRIRTATTQAQLMPNPTQGQPPTSTPEENLHPPQHLKNSQNP
ncbi:hypothetical protein ILYODFUR_022444 [Ilyodon furcidens]|uniref:Uncharacterized protein n=1 Tax=Ilyodon furcidens TaxID=33524 RepID=A0ABV0TCQ8_9TELE